MRGWAFVLVILLLLPTGAAATPTSVAISSPSPGAVLSGVVVVSGTAEPASAVSGVRLRVDLGPWSNATLGAVTGTTVAWSLTLDTQSYVDGAYLLWAETVTTGVVNRTYVNVTFVNQPSIVFTSPAPSTTVSGVLVATGTADSPYTPLSGVDFRMDTRPYVAASVSGSSTSLSWTASWDTTTLTNGVHPMRARVTNALGRTTETARAVIVANPPTVDLSVDAVTGSGQSDVVVTLRNDGNTASRAFDVRVEYEKDAQWRPYAVVRASPVPGFSTTVVKVAWQPTTGLVGTWTLRATADIGGVVTETDETDNVGVGSATFFTGLVTLPP